VGTAEAALGPSNHNLANTLPNTFDQTQNILGERRQRVRRLGFRRDGDSMEVKGPQCMALSGFSLHAARVVNREDRRG
jgi:hypothetical protein